MTTRDVLQQRLDGLEALMPELVRKRPDHQYLMREFCGYVDRITEETTAADGAWANEALDGIFTRYGFRPQEDQLAADG